MMLSKQKIRKNKTIGCFVLLICILLVSYSVIKYQEKTDSSTTNQAESFVSQKDVNIKNHNIQDENDRDWFLVLVNKSHPIEANYEIKLTELSNGECVDSRIYPQLQKMFDDMRNNGIYPVVASGYRTAQEQQQIYDNKIDEYISKGYSESDAKTEAEYWAAMPGTSEHQLGLAVDINADGINSYGDEVYDWLSRNAYRYGFIYRYQKDKVNITGVANEPWHYRYVGIEVATEIYNRNICLEEYMEEIY